MTFSLLRLPASVRLQTWACHELADCFSRTLLIIIKWGWISLREGEPSPILLSSEFAALTRACCGWRALCWQPGWRWWWAPGCDDQARQTWPRVGKAQDARGSDGRNHESTAAAFTSLLRWNHFCCWLNRLSTWKYVFRGVEASNCSSPRGWTQKGKANGLCVPPWNPQVTYSWGLWGTGMW